MRTVVAGVLVVVVGLTLANQPSSAAQQFLPLSIGDSPTMGSKSAKVVLMEFSDLYCPYCRRHATETLPRLKREYFDTGKVLYVFRNYPLDSHPGAMEAATAGACAAKEGKFWELHARFFSAQPVPAKDFEMHARAVGVDLTKFRTCVASQGKTDVAADVNEGNRIGVTGTPAFVFGLSQGKGTLAPFASVSGAVSYEAFKEALDKMLAIR